MHRSRCGLVAVVCAGAFAGLPLNALAQGWTNLTSPAGAQVFYVAATGSDSNPGSQAAPFRTLSRGYSALRDGQPDQVLLRCGDTFNESIDVTKGSNSASTYMVIGSYGTGERPKIRTTEVAFNFNHSVQGLAIVDLDVQPVSGHPLNMAWVPEGNRDILFEGVYSSGYVVIIASHAVNSGYINNLKIRRCVLVDAYAASAQQGHSIFAGDQQGFVAEENVLDRAGRDGGQNTIFLHSLYIHDANGAGPATVIGNIHARSCADSIQVRPGGTVVNNLSLQNPIGMTWGGNGEFRYNVAIDGRDISAEHGRAIAFNLSGSGPVEYNLAAHQQSGTDAITAFSMAGYNSGMVRGNCVYDWKSPTGQGWATAIQWDGGSGAVTVTGNTFYMPNIGMLSRHESRSLSSQFSYSGNTYYTSTPTGGVGGFQQFASTSNVGQSWSGWRSQAGESGSTFLGSAPTNPNATVGAYLQSLGIAPGADPIDTFMNEARKQSKQNWRYQFTAAGFNDWARGRMGMPLMGGGPPPVNCYANCDQSTASPVLTPNDFQCFVNAYGTGQSSANCDGVGGLTANDFQCFINAYTAGCQ